MNRNFLKISVSIVALLLALAFCMTGCKADDVAADLGTVKDEVAANKADATKALEEATKALENKLNANKTDCTAEIAAVTSALEKAIAEGKEDDEAIKSAVKALETALDAVRTDLADTKKELSDKISDDTAVLNKEIASLNAAIKSAQATLEAIDAENLANLTISLESLKAELEGLVADIELFQGEIEDSILALGERIDAVEEDIEELVAALDSAKKALEEGIANGDNSVREELIKTINALETAIKNASDANVEALQGKIDEANKALEDAKNEWDTTTAYIWVVMSKASEYFNTVNDEYDLTIVQWGDLLTYRNNMEVKLYRARTTAEADGYYDEFIKAVDNYTNEMNKEYSAIYQAILSAQDLVEEGKLDEAKALLAQIKEMLEPYADKDKLIFVNDGKINDLISLNKTTRANYSVAKNDAIIAELDAILNKINGRDAYTDTDENGEEIEIPAIIAVADHKELLAQKELLDAQKKAIDELAADYDATKATEKYNVVLNAHDNKYLALHIEYLSAQLAKYNDNLKNVFHDLGNYDGDLFNEKTWGDTLATIRANHDAFVAEGTYYHTAIANTATAENVNELENQVKALVADETVYNALVEFATSARDDVANILKNEALTDGITGNKSEYEILDANTGSYMKAYNAWLEKWNAFYADYKDEDGNYSEDDQYVNDMLILFTHKDTTYAKYVAKFEEATKDLIEAAKKMIEVVNNATNENGSYTFKLTDITNIREADDALDFWMKKTSDEQGLGYIVEIVSEGKFTQETLMGRLSVVKEEYNRFLANAKTAWTTVNTERLQALIANSEDLGVYDMIDIKAALEWFVTYGSDVEEAHALEGVGTKAIYETIVALRDACQTRIDAQNDKADAIADAISNLPAKITLASKDAVESIGADIKAWKNVVDKDSATNAKAGLKTVDETIYNSAVEALKAINDKIAEIDKAIAEIDMPKLGEDYSKPYFADIDAKTAFDASISAVDALIAELKELNDTTDGLIEKAVKLANLKVVDAKYNAIIKLYDAITSKKAEYSEENARNEYVKGQLDAALAEKAAYLDGMDYTNENLIKAFGNNVEAYAREVALAAEKLYDNTIANTDNGEDAE